MFFCGLSAPGIEIPRLIPYLSLKQRSHCDILWESQGHTQVWKLLLPSTALEGMAYNPTPPTLLQ